MQNSQYKTSYSALQTFNQCPQKYKFQYIDRIRAPKNKEAIFGTKIHDTLKFFHSQHMGWPTLDEMLNYFKDIWTSKPFQSEEEDIIYFSQGIKMLKKYYKYFLKNREEFTVLDTESRFKIPIKHPKHNKTCELVGKIDRIDKRSDGKIEVIDYKTSKSLPPQSKIDNDLQLSLYCLAVFIKWPNLNKDIKDIKLTFHFLKHSEVLTTSRTKQQLEDIKNQIWDKVNEIEKKEFKPIPSGLCDWCGYKDICPMWKHKYVKEISPTEQEIQKIIKEFFELKNQNSKNNKKIADLAKKINSYLDNQKIERIFSEKCYITRLPQARYKYNMKKLKEILKPIGKWEEVLTVDSKKLKKIIKSLPCSAQRKIQKTKKKEKEFTTLRVNRNS